MEALLSAYDGSEDDAFLDTPALGMMFPVTAVETTDLPNLIGRYRIIEPLGEGGMARVFVAEQERPRRRVALKIMKALLGPRAEKRFELEALVLGRLRHPGIAQIYEAGIHQTDTGRLPFIAMELVEGERLTTIVNQRQLDQATTLSLFTRICDAVQHAHQQGVIHRDLKPSNILVEDRDGQLLPKILDLGIARATDLDIQATTMGTGMGELVGTLTYMSPEQAAGDPHEIDTRSDVYSLGVILYEILTGQLPFELQGRPIHEAVRIIREDDPPTMSSLNTMFRGDLDVIALKAMEKDKNRRYQSARDLTDDVRRYLDNEPITARQPSAVYQLRKFARRHRVFVVGAVCSGIALTIGLIGMTWFAFGKSRALAAESLALEKSRADRQAAETAQKKAERRFDEVRDLASVFIGELDGKIRHLPGSTEARQFIVSTGLAYLDSLEKESRDDRDLQMQLAIGYFKLGDIQGYPDEANLGDRAGAWNSYQKGLALLSLAGPTNANDLKFQRTLSLSYSHCAAVLSLLGRRDEARTYNDDAYELLQKIAAQRPDEVGVMANLAYHENRFGDEALHVGDWETAEPHFRKARELYESILAQSPGNMLARRGIAAAHDRSARLELMRGDTAKAIEHCQAFIQATRGIVDSGDGTSSVFSDLATGYERLGVNHRSNGNREAALEAFTESRKIRESLMAQDPRNNRIIGSLRYSYCYVGEELLALGRRDAALEQFQKGLDISRRLAQAEPDNRRARRELAVAFYKMAEWNLNAADHSDTDASDVETFRRKALDWLEQCKGVFVDMRERDLLGVQDAGVINQLALEIDACRKSIPNLETQVTKED